MPGKLKGAMIADTPGFGAEEGTILGNVTEKVMEVINKIRARSRAPAVEIIASPGVVVDTVRSEPCDTAATDSATACRPAANK